MVQKKQTPIRLEPEALARVDALAKAEKRPRAAMLRILVDEALDARERARRPTG